MQLYDQYIDTLENLESRIHSPTETDKQALETAADALSFVQGVQDMFIAHGIVLPEIPDMYKLEGVLEGYVGELIAAIILLSNYQMGDTPKALEKLSSNEDLKKELPASVMTGFLRLADRVKKTRVSQQKVITDRQKLS